MKPTILPLLLVVIPLALLSACSEIKTPDDRMELRGVWITNVDSDVMFDRKSTAEAMQYLSDRGFNIVYPVVWNAGYTLYPSDVMVDYFGEDYRVDPRFTDPDRDPLKDIIIEARKHGMEVMPWFEYGFASSHDKGGGHILESYPHWAAKDSSGVLLSKNNFEWMNAFHHEVQEFILALIAEVIENYDIDGIQGDDRLPALPAEGGYSEYTRDLYYEDFGEEPPLDPREEPFLQWKADRLSDFGEQMYDMVKSYDTELSVSLSPSIYDWSKKEYLQDWTEWVRRGTVDLLHPQIYRYDIQAYLDELEVQQEYFLEAMEERDPESERDQNIYHAPGVLIKVGDNYNGPEYVRRAIDRHHELGLDGEVYFFYEGLHEENDHLGDSIYAHHYRKPAFIPHRDFERRKPAYRLPHDYADTTNTGEWQDAEHQGAWKNRLMVSESTGAANRLRLFISDEGYYDIMVHVPFENIPEEEIVYVLELPEEQFEYVMDVSAAKQGGWHILDTRHFRQGERFHVTVKQPEHSTKPVWFDGLMFQRNHHYSIQ